MASETTTQDNILSCGYLREFENDNKFIIPNIIQQIIGMYCKVCNAYGIGTSNIRTSSEFRILASVNKLFSKSDDITANGYGTNIRHGQNELFITSNNLNSSYNKPLNLIKISTLSSISVISSGVSNDTELYIYTADGCLYKSDINAKHKNKNKLMICPLKQIDTSFLNDNDTIIDIKCGLAHTLFLTELGNVYSCGENDVGQCGFDRCKYSKIIQPKLAINYKDHKTKMITAGAFHSLALNSHGQLICFGYNICGQLGIDLHVMPLDSEISDEDSDTVYETDEDGPLFSFIDISDDEGEEHKDAMLSTIDTPIINDYFDDLDIKIIKIYAGKHHSLCISDTGKAYTFGQNIYGNLGNGEATDYGTVNSIPYEINNKFGFIIDGSCGENHNLLLNKDNKIICFGNNCKNQCTQINQTKIMTPIFVSKMELGLNYNCFIEKVTCLKNESLIFVDVYSRR